MPSGSVPIDRRCRHGKEAGLINGWPKAVRTVRGASARDGQKRRWAVRLGSLALLLVLVPGCQSAHYYGQALGGQMDLMARRRPISQLLDQPKTPATLKSKLRAVLRLRRFAAEELFLPVDAHYLAYADLERSYAVWCVYAAPEFSLRPKTWCYPIVGCVAYRGYFSAEAAERCAADLTRRGYDVFVGGVTAYSTLGWFEDPVLSTVLNSGEVYLARVLFHELAHQVVYASGDTVFSESFATAVEEEGLRRWMASRQDTPAWRAYQAGRRRHKEFVALVLRFRAYFEALYARDLPAADKRCRKKVLYTELRAAYADLKQRWGGYAGYDRWFEDSLNNAKLATVVCYNDLTPALHRLLKACGGDLPAFYQTCRKLAAMTVTRRHAILAAYAPPTPDQRGHRPRLPGDPPAP
jgi:predicted aminopeptidase